MAYEQVQKPSSSFVPVQKKVSEFAPSASRVQAKDVTAGEQEQIPLGSTPATDANWLMKHPLFKGNQFLQRVVAPASESESLESEEETLQRQEEGNESATPYSLPVQAKLTIGEPGDKYEQEADRVASQVVKQINSPEAAQSTQGQSVQRQEEPVEELQAKPSISDLQRTPLPLEVQRVGMPEGEELQAKSLLQRREAIAGGEASTDLDTAINSARGSGQPLDAGLQRSMGQAMGADFSRVKVHTDAQSDQLNQSIQAKAFTTGQDVFFRQGAYDPGSRGGQELIAHELTHVVQQSGGAVQRSPLDLSDVTTTIAGRGENSTKSLKQNPLVVQRVTYKETKYDPAVEEEQTKFLTEAEKDLKAKKAWVEGRSKRLMTVLGLTEEVIPTVDALIQKEKDKWQDFDKAIEADITDLDQPLRMIEEVSKQLAESLPFLKKENKSKEIEANLKLLDEAISLIPEKMRLTEVKTLRVVKQTIEEYINMRPWEAEAEGRKLESKKQEELNKIKDDEEINNIDDDKERQKKITRKQAALEKKYKKSFAELDKIPRSEKKVEEAITKMAGVPVAIPDSLRKSAEQQYERGREGYRFAERIGKDRKKLYIGQIEDTEKTKDTRDKGRGVLWATPWSPGVNVGFIEGGIAGKQVFKLRTDIPSELKTYLEEGNIDSFKAVVKGKEEKKYWPFWQGQEKRFTLFTQELETLLAHGYKLREFKRKSDETQQIMATEDHMEGLKEYYKDRK
jgi:hypothetical protein